MESARLHVADSLTVQNVDGEELGGAHESRPDQGVSGEPQGAAMFAQVAPDDVNRVLLQLQQPEANMHEGVCRWSLF